MKYSLNAYSVCKTFTVAIKSLIGKTHSDSQGLLNISLIEYEYIIMSLLLGNLLCTWIAIRVAFKRSWFQELNFFSCYDLVTWSGYGAGSLWSFTNKFFFPETLSVHRVKVNLNQSIHMVVRRLSKLLMVRKHWTKRVFVLRTNTHAHTHTRKYRWFWQLWKIKTMRNCSVLCIVNILHMYTIIHYNWCDLFGKLQRMCRSRRDNGFPQPF